jgi:CubicO group peptidase (beta-lactamase class C family)
MKLFFYTLILSGLTYCSTAQTALSPRQRHQLDSISVQDVPQGAPGIASGIVLNGEIVYRKYAGYANLKDSSLIDAQSRFNIASNGKQFTALAILTLIDQKKINLTDDIRSFLPEIFTTIPEKISIEHLLSHTSGIRDVYDLWALQGITWWKQTFNNADVLKILQQQRELNFKPGTHYAYSNSNYILLAEIVQVVTGQSFTTYTNSMFKKLNMPNTSFESDYKKIREPIALPYFNFDRWFGYNWICNIQGDGNTFSTLEDQLQWEKIIQTKKSPFLSKKIIEQSQQLTPAAFTNQYGYGLEYGTYKNIPYQFHEGATGAWKATTIRFADKRLSIVTLTNSGKTIPSQQTRQLADVVLGIKNQRGIFKTTPTAVGTFISAENTVGIYQDENNFTFTFERRDTSLYLLRNGRNDIRLEREAANIFYQWNDPAFKQEFTKNEQGELQVTAYYTSHAPYTLTRPEVNWEGFDYSAWNGNFHNDETGVSFQLKHQFGNKYEVTVRDQKEVATLITPDKLMFNNYTLVVLRNTVGEITALLLSGDRVKKIRFVRALN